MRILVLSTVLPLPTTGSGTRIYELVKGLQKKKHDIAIGFLYNSREYNLAQLHKLTKQYKKCYLIKLSERTVAGTILSVVRQSVPYLDALKRNNNYFNQLKEFRPDIVQYEELGAYYAFRYFDWPSSTIHVLDAHNVEFSRLSDEYKNDNAVKKIVAKVFIERIKRIEIKSAQSADLILTCSETDSKYFSLYVEKDKLIQIPNGANEKIHHNRKKTGNILFMGHLGYPPNLVGIKRYIEKIHPLIHSAKPKAKLVVVGREQPEWLVRKARVDKSIDFLGFVDDIDEVLNEAEVCICPIYSGSGTRLKILEYMAAAKSVVTTAKGCEGLNVTNEVNILIANTDIEFAAAVIKLLNDKNLNDRIGKEARTLITKNYRWDTITANLHSEYARRYS